MKDSVGVFEAQRPRLSGLAYRLPGSACDAGDVVQDAAAEGDVAGLERLLADDASGLEIRPAEANGEPALLSSGRREGGASLAWG